MKTIMLLGISSLLLLCACTQPDRTREILRSQGYTNIEITGYEIFGCAEKDFFHTGFTATSPNGSHIRGIACGGILKGITIRFK